MNPDLELAKSTLSDDTATTGGSAWSRSSYCSDGSCVEVSITEHQVGVRDNKNLSGDPIWMSVNEWRTFVAAIRAGEFS